MSDPGRVVLSYQRPLPRARVRARLVFWAMALLGLALFVLGLASLFNPLLQLAEGLGGGTLGTPFAPLRPSSEDMLSSVYLAEACGYLAIFLLSQWLFLIPRGTWRLRLLGGGTLTRRSAVAGGFIAMLLCIGLLATLMEIPEWWTRLTLIERGSGREARQDYRIVWVVMAAVWALWALVFWRYGKSVDRHTAMTRIVRGLVAGTFLELLVAAPVHAWVVMSGRDDCYCTRGSYTGVVFGCTALVWLFGPGIVLLWLRELKRRQRMLDSDDPGV